MDWFSVFFITWTVFFLYMIHRVNEVANFRRYLLSQIAISCLLDIRESRSWHWRYEEFKKVSFEEMVKKFWWDVRGFYRDYSFCVTSEEEDES